MIRIYEYGLLDPIYNSDLVDEQIRLAHRYRNKLTEIERRRREAVAAIMVGHPDTEALASEVTRLAEEREVARAAIQHVKKAARGREVEKTADARTGVRELATKLRAARLALKAAKSTIIGDPAITAALDAAEQTARQEVRDARAECGAYWGSYLLQEQAADAARKSKTPPKFRRFDGEGAVSVQLQGGLAVDDVWGADTQIRIERMPIEPGDERTTRGERRVARYHLHLRVQSTDKGKPVWATWPLILHRDIPPDATIKIATVQRRRHDYRRWRWTVQLMLAMPEGARRRPLPPEGTAVALNLGWCQRPDGGLRAGFVIGSDGYESEIVLPRSIPERLAKAESLRSIRDKNLDVLRPALVAALGELNLGQQPEWLVERSQFMHAWRAPARFRALAMTWRQQRFEGDEDAYAMLEAWRYRDEHLYHYEIGCARGALGHRREIYRRVAADMSSRYRTLIVDDTDLRDIQRSPRPEDERTEIATVKYQQRIVSPHQLKLTLVQQFAEVDKHKANDITRRCYGLFGEPCGSIEIWDRARAGRDHTCSRCGRTWDQDANACRNLMRAHRERPDAPNDPSTARGDKPAERKLSRSDRLRGSRRKDVQAAPLET